MERQYENESDKMLFTSFLFFLLLVEIKYIFILETNHKYIL
jgi:hypothetical protein